MVEKPEGLRYCVTFRIWQVLASFQAFKIRNPYNGAAFLQNYKSLPGFHF
jgi:hypothetical protein